MTITSGHSPDSRRYATLVAVVLDADATLTDENVELHERFHGNSS